MSHKSSSSDYVNTATPQFWAAVAARFWTKVRRGRAGACWLWTGSVYGRPGFKYGQFVISFPDGTERHDGAHRVAWTLTRGPIPAGGYICHTCDIPLCCNPAHLFLGTHKVNMRDAAAKKRFSVPRPGRQKLTPAQLSEIDALLRAGVKRNEIAARFGVSKAWVSLYAHGKRRQYDRKPGQAKVA